jgi:hypothetical protein
MYLMTQSTGKFKPKKFQHALNEQILPLLRYMLDTKLSEHMAR